LHVNKIEQNSIELKIAFTVEVKIAESVYGRGKGFFYPRRVKTCSGKKPEGKCALRRARGRWVVKFKMNRREIGCGGMNWIDLAQDRDWWKATANTVMNLLVS
jgi:hypothetical protein